MSKIDWKAYYDRLTPQQKACWDESSRRGADYVDNLVLQALTGEYNGKTKEASTDAERVREEGGGLPEGERSSL